MFEYNRLTEFAGTRRRFNPADKKDLKELVYFQTHHRWMTKCPFLLEYPYKDIITMCQVKYSEYMLK